MPTVVFDFDKTLTRKDTVLGFLLTASEKKFVSFRLLVLILFAVLHKCHLINNCQLKKLGISLFLKGSSEEHIRQKAIEYAACIEMNVVYRDEYLGKFPGAIIATASFEDYVKPLCKEGKIMGAQLAYKNGMVSGLLQNAYGKQKVAILQKSGFKSIDIFYTDSYTDQPLMDISATVYLVKNNGIKKIKG